MTQGAFHRIVRRLDPVDPRECPEALLHFEDLEAGRRRLHARKPRPFRKGRFHLSAGPVHLLLKRFPLQRPVARLMPVVEQHVGQRKQPAGGRGTTTSPVDHCRESHFGV